MTALSRFDHDAYTRPSPSARGAYTYDDEIEIKIGLWTLGVHTISVDVVRDDLEDWLPGDWITVTDRDHGTTAMFPCLTFTGRRSSKPGLEGAMEDYLSARVADMWPKIEKWAEEQYRGDE